MTTKEKLDKYLELEHELLIFDEDRNKAKIEKLQKEKSELEKKIPQLVDEAAERIKQKLIQEGHIKFTKL